MSAVRMCDRCGTIFSENAEGWGVGTVSTNVKDPVTGRKQLVQQSADLCPNCNTPVNEHVAPQLAIHGPDKPASASHIGAFTD